MLQRFLATGADVRFERALLVKESLFIAPLGASARDCVARLFECLLGLIWQQGRMPLSAPSVHDDFYLRSTSLRVPRRDGTC